MSRTKGIEVVAVNDINPDIENITYTMNYDSLYSGYIKKKFTCNGQNIDYDGKNIKVYCIKEFDHVSWAEHEIDVLIDCTE